MARQRHGKMRHVWDSSRLHVWLKLRLYIAGVCSVMVYGSETWTLTPAVQRLLNGANSQMVAKITGNTIRAEASAATRTYDLVASIRATRLRWLGQILRMDEGRMVKNAVRLMHGQRKEGDLLMDTPATATWQELCDMAADEKGWQKEVQAIKAKVHSKKKSKSERGEDKKRQKGKKNGKEQDREEDEDGDGNGDGWGGAMRKRSYKRINQVVRCGDGFSMSVQASLHHYCTPRQDDGPYTHVEVGGPSELEELLLPYADGPNVVAGLRPDVYVNVPAAVVRAVLAKHGGMVAGQLPQMTPAMAAGAEEDGMPALMEADEDSSSDMLTEDETDEEDEGDALTSVVHLGAPPPPPPTSPPPETVTGEEQYEVEYNENGYMWAAAAQPPEDTPSTLMLDDSSGIQMGSPVPPALSEVVARMGEITPPATLAHAMFSPIHYDEYDNDEDIEEVD